MPLSLTVCIYFLLNPGYLAGHNLRNGLRYCNRTNFRTRFNFVYFVLFTESTKFSSIRKPYTYACVSHTTVAVRKFLAYESRQTLEYEIFTRTKISAITVFENVSHDSIFEITHQKRRNCEGQRPHTLYSSSNPVHLMN